MQKHKGTVKREDSQIYLRKTEREFLRWWNIIKNAKERVQNTKLAWRLCRATQHFDDGTSKCKIWAQRQVYMIYADWRSIKISFTPLQARGMEKITAWRSRKFFFATQKNKAFITKSTCSNKILQIRKNNSTFILLLQNKAISLLRNSKQQNNH